MRLLLGRPSSSAGERVTEADPLELYLAADRPQPEGRPWVALSMITSLDGATAADGRSGGLGGPADKEVFRAVRAVADVILVAAGTVRAEGYGPVRLSDTALAARAEEGRDETNPRPAIVTASLDLDLESDLFTAPSRPIVLTTTDADPGRVRETETVADVHAHGAGRVDLRAALGHLAANGAGVVVCEGGPSLNSALAAVDCIDEVCMTIAPVIAGGPSPRLAATPAPLSHEFRLDSLLEEDGMLFGRWIRH